MDRQHHCRGDCFPIWAVPKRANAMATNERPGTAPAGRDLARLSQGRDLAQNHIQQGFRGCWIMALGTN
jgi:hypothetical protein